MQCDRTYGSRLRTERIKSHKMTREELVEQQLGLGMDHYESGRLEEAMAAWREGMQGDADDAAYHYNLGLALSDLGQTDEAAAQWREAIRMGPDFYEPLFHLVVAISTGLKSGKDKVGWRELRDLCREALALDPSDASQRAYLLQTEGVAEWEWGDRQAAMDSLRAAIEAEPRNPRHYETLGQMQRLTGDWRGMARTVSVRCQEADFDSACYESCVGRLRLIGVVLLVAGVGLLLRKWRRGR